MRTTKVTFRNPHDLLIYLVRLSDSEQHWRLNSGESLAQAMVDDGEIDSTHEIERLAEWLFALKEDGSIDFDDYGASVRRGRWVGFNDFQQAARIRVTSSGRLATRASAPTVNIGQFAVGDITNLDLTIFLEAVEREIDNQSGPAEAKLEAHSRIKAAKDALMGIGAGATGEVLAAALRSALGFP